MKRTCSWQVRLHLLITSWVCYLCFGHPRVFLDFYLWCLYSQNASVPSLEILAAKKETGTNPSKHRSKTFNGSMLLVLLLKRFYLHCFQLTQCTKAMSMEGSRLAATDLHAFLSSIMRLSSPASWHRSLYQRSAYDSNPSNDPNRIENWDLIPCLTFEKCPVHIKHISVHS